MAERNKRLAKQPVVHEPTHAEPHPPPMAEGPDMAETLRLLEKVSRLPDIRFDKVQHMRDLIARDALETPERIDGTVDRLMEELGL
jgi:hypothetical protein